MGNVMTDPEIPAREFSAAPVPVAPGPPGSAEGPVTDYDLAVPPPPVAPATGPLPDKYLILSDGRTAGTVAGTVTSYRKAGLTPASNYQYRVVAIRDGKRSPQSASLAVNTLIPPMSQ